MLHRNGLFSYICALGVSGGGKTVLSRFVAWMNGQSVFQIKVNKKYSIVDFDNDLRTVMKRAGCKGERICFIFDESNVLDSAFLERMNALLAAGEVPGLFEGDDYTALMHACREAASKQSVLLNTEEELYRYVWLVFTLCMRWFLFVVSSGSWFKGQVQRNLHVVFTINPDSKDFHNRTATSPALFNRCVLDWYGDWPNTALYQVMRRCLSFLSD